MSELHSASETAGTGAAAPREVGRGQESADHQGRYPDAAPGDSSGGFSDADIEAMLAAEERQPESRLRQDAAADTWGDSADDPDGSELAAEYDGDLDALLAAEQDLPESRTRQEAAAGTWDDTTQPADDDPASFSGDPAAEYDGDVAALLAAEERLPESRTRQDAAATTWDDTPSGQASATDTSTGDADPGQPDAVTGPPVPDGEGADGTPGLYESQVAVHATDGTDVPVTVAFLSPEDRTVGDTTPTGIGRKPTGEEFLDMEGDDPAKSRLERLFDEALKEGDDFSDAAGHMGAAIEADVHSGPGPSGHPGSYHATTGSAPDHPASPDPGVSDAVGSMAIVGVAAALAIRHALSGLWKEHKP